MQRATAFGRHRRALQYVHDLLGHLPFVSNPKATRLAPLPVSEDAEFSNDRREAQAHWLTRAKVGPQEMKEIVTAYKDKGDANGVKHVQSSGLHVAGERYVVLKADERSLYGKKVSRRHVCSPVTSTYGFTIGS